MHVYSTVCAFIDILPYIFMLNRCMGNSAASSVHVINQCSFLQTITYLSFCYIHIFIYKLILFVVQFEPELVIVSAGYDSAIGDPKVIKLFVMIIIEL